MAKEERVANVWDGNRNVPSQAASMKARSDLMMAVVRKIVDCWKGTQAEAAKRLGITRPRRNDLLRGRSTSSALMRSWTLRPARAYRFTPKSAVPRDFDELSEKYFLPTNTATRIPKYPLAVSSTPKHDFMNLM